ncbi:enoyl-CoA hydratase/isomerase family protein [Novosphingobium sp. FKTRR1]|uniref:enoyl-CoA hydratase/isomerase family protein n=1 Tax=Novosphingobium sp. FKTRR1 TaxID=2879118 RepID=UPI001CF006E0|nr:enoyl-CoA hydratase-related protein [Novosphingobium sp. FKTRR1]
MSAVLLEKTADGVARLTLNRPEQGNAIDFALAEALRDGARDAAADPAVRVVVLTGAGRMFCVGGDIGLMAGAADSPGPVLRQLAETLHDAVSTLADMAKPLVVLVNGPAAGAGLSLAALGDIVLAVPGAHFTAAYSAIGLTPDGGMSWLLPRLVGLRVAQEMVLTNRRVKAEEAVSLGLITRVVEAEALESEGAALLAKLADGPTQALGKARWLLAEAHTNGLAVHLDLEAQSIASAAAGAEGLEGVAAFLAKRKPDFRG